VRLRNAHLAVVDRGKVTDYLLNPDHPRNAGKSVFFETLGFSLDAPEELVEGLTRMSAGDVTERVETEHGDVYAVEGPLSGPDPTRPARMVRTVWIVDITVGVPRLVTAYPARR